MALTEPEIIQLLRNTRKKALALYSQFKVGAVLVSSAGDTFTGFNIESSSYGLTICAERVALFKALTEGSKTFSTIYVMGDSRDPCPPCGACRQVLQDYAPGVDVVMVSLSGKIIRRNLKELLPFAFDSSQL